MRIILYIICYGFSLNLHGQHSIESYLDSSKQTREIAKQILFTEKALVLSKQQHKDSLWYESQRRLCNIEYGHNLKNYKNRSVEFIENALSQDNSKRIAEGNYLLGNYYLKASLYDSAYYHFNEAKLIRANLKDSLNCVSNLRNMAIIRLNNGAFYESERISTEALSFLHTIDSIEIESAVSVYNNLGITSNELGNYEKALSWYNKTLNLVSRPIEKLVILNNIGIVYGNLKNYSEAIFYFKRALKEISPPDYVPYRAMVKDNLAYHKFLSGDQTVRQDLLEALSERKTSNTILGQIVSFMHLAEFELKVSNSKQSFEYAQRALLLADSIGDSKHMKKSLAFLVQHHNNPSYSKRYISLTDSLLKKERVLENKFALIDFESAKKQKENLILLSENFQQQVELTQSRTRNLVLGIIVLLLVIATMGILLYVRVRRKTQEKDTLIQSLEAKVEERNRISGQLHDDIASDLLVGLQQGELLYQNSKDEKIEKVLSLFERAYEKMRMISQENQSVDFDKIPFEKIIASMIKEHSFNSTVHITEQGIQAINWKSIESSLKQEFLLVIQEALVNIHKHSKADSVKLNFSQNQKKLHITISDNGIGIQEKKNEGTGMESMRRRIEKMNGSLEVHSENQKGTKLILTLPI